MQLGLDGASPGEDTEHVLAAQLLIFRLTGAMSLLLLFFVSRWADAYLKSIAGIPLSVNELLIVAGTVIQCRNTVCFQPNSFESDYNSACILWQRAI